MIIDIPLVSFFLGFLLQIKCSTAHHSLFLSMDLETFDLHIDFYIILAGLIVQ